MTLTEVIAQALRDCDPQEAGVDTKAARIAHAVRAWFPCAYPGQPEPWGEG